jgi:opacity protein-like surface antigen
MNEALRALVVGAALLASQQARAQSVEGTGRVAVHPGWRYTPNETFRASAADVGHPLTRRSPGGPQITGTFAYAASASIEAAIDLFAGYERLRLDGTEAVTSVTYGALVGFRAFANLGDRLVPNAGLGLGPVLVYTSGGPVGGPAERLVTGYAALAGISYRLTDSVAVSADARWLLARGTVSEIGGVNGGGAWAGIGVTWLIPPDPSRPGALQ